MAEVEADEAEDKVIRLLYFQCDDADAKLNLFNRLRMKQGMKGVV